MSKKSTIKDIAEQLGVSKALVSFVLTGKSKEKRISADMTAKVLNLAKQLNYKPNYLAKSLRTGKSNTIALIVADISNPFFAKFARFIEIEASKHNYKVIFGNSDEKPEKFATELDVLKNGQVDGFILTPPIGSESELLNLQTQKMPFVIVDRIFKSIEAHTVNINNFQSGYEATLRLIKNKRKNIALVHVNNQLFTMNQRVEGFHGALKHSKIKAKPSLIKHLKFSHEKALVMKAVKEIIKEGADALLFTTSKLGVLGIECLRELGVRIPEDVAVISFDDRDAYKVSYTPISAIVQPVEQMSKEAVRILIRMLEGKYGEGEYENILMDVEYIFRASCV